MALRTQDKRQGQRVKLRLPLRCRIRGQGEYKNAITEDISSGGLSFIHDRYLSPRADLNLELNILQRVLSPLAKAVWVMPLAHSPRYRVGVKFAEFDLKEEQYLKDYINTLTANE